MTVRPREVDFEVDVGRDSSLCFLNFRLNLIFFSPDRNGFLGGFDVLGYPLVLWGSFAVLLNIMSQDAILNTC